MSPLNERLGGYEYCEGKKRILPAVREVEKAGRKSPSSFHDLTRVRGLRGEVNQKESGG
jgi:hypothetical protein